MYTVIIYSKLTNEILFEKTFSDYYRAYGYAQNRQAANSWYEIVEEY